ncbi:MAG: glycogen debranching protein GlgX [Woeseiaceae bacterium]
MIEKGHCDRLGPSPDEYGCNFALYSAVAERVELCLFDAHGSQSAIDLPDCQDGVWHGYVPGCTVGQRYGYRVHGPFDPSRGLRCNPSKLLIDPYARRLVGEFQWHDAVFDSNTQDSATYVPLGVVTGYGEMAAGKSPNIPWGETIFYECNARGLTMRHPDIPAHDRGKFAGLSNSQIVDYIKALGITSVELMPVHAFIDEHHLAKLGLRNFWGYNSISFFAPMPRYASADADVELRDAVRTLHDAGLEVILDVAYNHTGESGGTGPTLSFRGIDNLTYYRTDPHDPGSYINDTGCGNTVDVEHPRVRELILESLGYYATVMGVDGFRFDLATILGRRLHGFTKNHPLLLDISNDARLRNKKLIAEPWDPGPGGYQLGNFPPRWSEWNDAYRDGVRQFWRGDPGKSGVLARRMYGSADIFEQSGRGPLASVNFIAVHDGFTLQDTVSYERRHNEANGERNRDGHAHNFSSNYGEEGPSDDAALVAWRRRQRLNMLSTLLLSQGTPLLLAGDEFGNSQGGNNNAYAQDNDTGWLDWSGLHDDPEFTDQVRELLWLRRELPLLRLPHYVHGVRDDDLGQTSIQWVNKHGHIKQGNEWANSRAFTKVISRIAPDGTESSIAILINASAQQETMSLVIGGHRRTWRVAFCSAEHSPALRDGLSAEIPQASVTLLVAD